ncbi:MAG: type II secretion system protein [Planctomycetota bacterium]|jgi:prepilin-type processing-associated H-X9-DG protein/prepilin-type N-terminal cleavage/methylation domain-containing protein
MRKVFFREKKSCFTLVELLVVIAIISVLAGMLMPALENALGSARSISCLNIEKQLIMADVSYSEDYDGYIVPYYAYSKIWNEYLHDYFAGKDTGYFMEGNPVVCPSNPYQKANTSGYHFHNYAYNLRTRIASSPDDLRFRRLASVKNPSTGGVFGDSSLRDGFGDGECVNYWMMWSDGATVGTSYVSNAICLGHMVHSGGMNIGFLDGHSARASIGDIEEFGGEWLYLDE